MQLAEEYTTRLVAGHSRVSPMIGRRLTITGSPPLHVAKFIHRVRTLYMLRTYFLTNRIEPVPLSISSYNTIGFRLLAVPLSPFFLSLQYCIGSIPFH